jgi:hypothetical protein
MFPEGVGVMVKFPFVTPFVVGVKLTAKVHLAFAASVPLHGLELLPTAEKSPLVAHVNVTLWLWLLVSVMVCATEVDPTLVAAKVRLFDMDSANIPLPVRPTTCGAPTAVSLTVIAPGMDPTIVGANVTVMVQVCPGVSVAPLQLLVCE